MQAFSERKKYCANCGREIKPGQGIELNYRYTVCSEECKKEIQKEIIMLPCKFCGNLNRLGLDKHCGSCGAPIK